jgi:Fur family transcriptional regulator, ferric uptake regulator
VSQTHAKMEPSRVERLCAEKGLKMTEQRRVIARVLSEAEDHPDVEEVYRRASAQDSGISLATVYRAMKMFEDAGVVQRLDVGDGRAHYEEARPERHHHLIDVESGAVIEFADAEVDAILQRIAHDLGYVLVGQRLALFGIREKDGDRA